MADAPKYGLRFSGCTVILCAALAICLPLVGCGPSAPKVAALPLPPKVESGPAKLKKQSGGFYEVNLGDEARPEIIYATALEQCGPSVKHSIASLSRQLLVGLEKVRITSRKEVEIQSCPGFELTASALLEGSSVSIRSFSVKVSQCVVDVVFWRGGDSNNVWTSKPAAESSLLSVAQEIINSYRGRHAFRS